MANYSELIATINEQIKANGNQEITGPVLNAVLKAMVSALGEGYQFMGVATPTTNPGTPDTNVFYICYETGNYTNFKLEVNTNLSLIYNKDNQWNLLEIPFVVNGKVDVELFTGLLLSNGSISSNKAWKYSNYIEVKSGDKLYINITNKPSSPYVTVQTYNTVMSVLKNYVKPDVPNIIDITEDGFVRVSGQADTTIEVYSLLLDNKIKEIEQKITKNEQDIEEVKQELTTYYPIELEFENKLINANGTTSSNRYWRTSNYIEVKSGDKLYINITNKPGSPYVTVQTYNTVMSVLKNYVKPDVPNIIDITEDGFVRVSGQADTTIEVSKIISLQELAKDIAELKEISGRINLDKNINFVGMSIWWYDGKILASGMGGGEVAIGYQSLIKNIYSFISDTGTNYCYSGFSLGGLSDDDVSSICNKMNTWQSSEKAIWTLDTITNDFKRNIPIGTINDYNNNTGKTTYFGALRIFTDKIQELSGDDKVVIVSNSLRRNNSGYTSTSENTAGHTLLDYEKALMEIAVKNKWWFVDQFRLCGVTDDTIAYTTIDGLHLNNLGYKLAVIPWINVLKAIFC